MRFQTEDLIGGFESREVEFKRDIYVRSQRDKYMLDFPVDKDKA